MSILLSSLFTLPHCLDHLPYTLLAGSGWWVGFWWLGFTGGPHPCFSYNCIDIHKHIRECCILISITHFIVIIFLFCDGEMLERLIGRVEKYTVSSCRPYIPYFS